MLEEWRIPDGSATEENGIIHFRVNVTNTGSMEGKEVIQIYAGAPQGILGKPAKSLVAFQKTRLLKAGETQLLCLEFSADAMASYDDSGKIQKSSYVLEAGDYVFFAGNSVRNATIISFVYTVPQNGTGILSIRLERQAPGKLRKTTLLFC